MSKLISIIVPVYNVESYLERCLESIMNQSYSALQVILIDDDTYSGDIHSGNNHALTAEAENNPVPVAVPKIILFQLLYRKAILF